MDFTSEPQPLSARERRIVLIAAVVCAATRFLALARSLWDWDEAQFALALRDFDVAAHQPHPPGFPLYVALAKLMSHAVGDEFRALQSVTMLASLLVFPAMFLFARELRAQFRTAVASAMLFAFFPNVWFYGGAAFSDVPSIVLVLFAVTLLLRGVRQRSSYWLGALLLALAIAIRPQNLLLGLIPGVHATRHRRPAEVVVALVIGLLVCGAAFGGAVAATGSLERYMTAVEHHADYIATVDSWRSPARPPMWRLADRFFVKQYQSPALGILLSLFVLGSIWRSFREKSRPMLWNALTFVPFAIFAWVMLDRFSVSRFSIGYQPMFALFAADGMRRFAHWSSVRFARNEERLPARAETGLVAVIIAAFAVWTLPALGTVRSEEAPSVLAVRAVERTLQRDQQLYVAHTMTRFVDLESPGRPYIVVLDDRALPLAPGGEPWLLAEVNRTEEEGLVFKRRRGTLWNIARRHYFEVKLAPLTRRAVFGEGWHGGERDGAGEWRWMAEQSHTLLPPAEGTTMLRLTFDAPEELAATGPMIRIRLNGVLLDEFPASPGEIHRDLKVTPGDGDNVLELSIAGSIRPADRMSGGDERRLGLRLRYLSWGRW